MTPTGDGILLQHIWNTKENGIEGVQKNWLPVEDRPFHFIMGTYEHGTQWIDISTNEICETGTVDKNNLYRGNTPLVKVEGGDISNGYITITHKVINEPYKVKEYQNFVVRLDDGLNVVGISRSFKLTHHPIEFITTLLKNGGDWWIGDTSNDDTPFLCKVNTIEDLIHEVLQGYNVGQRGCF